VALELGKMGIKAMALKGGWKEWEKAGYPTEPKK
jgi:3-mercaptopyruvate sulfurtransferase SseA